MRTSESLQASERVQKQGYLDKLISGNNDSYSYKPCSGTQKLFAWLVVFLVTGCANYSSSPYQPASELAQVSKKAVIWVYYQSDDDILSRSSRPNAEVRIDGQSVGVLQPLQHGLIVLEPGKKVVSVTFSGFLMKPTTSVRVTISLKESLTYTLSFTAPVGSAALTQTFGGVPVTFDQTVVSSAGKSAWFFDDGETAPIRASNRAFVWK